jgi:hypothetical protein
MLGAPAPPMTRLDAVVDEPLVSSLVVREEMSSLSDTGQTSSLGSHSPRSNPAPNRTLSPTVWWTYTLLCRELNALPSSMWPL